MTIKETKNNLLIAFSSYSTHNNIKVSISDWLDVQDMKRNDQDFKKKYEHLKSR